MGRSGKRPEPSRRSCIATLSKAAERSAQPVCRLRASTRKPARAEKFQNLVGDYSAAIQRLHDLGVMVNASFVFGMDHDDETVFDRTVEWAIGQGIETATFHILTPYPGTASTSASMASGRITTHDWDRYDTRHGLSPGQMTAETLEAGYWRAYRDFYRWGSIFRGAATRETLWASFAIGICWWMEEFRAAVGPGYSDRPGVPLPTSIRNRLGREWKTKSAACWAPTDQSESQSKRHRKEKKKRRGGRDSNPGRSY